MPYIPDRPTFRGCPDPTDLRTKISFHSCVKSFRFRFLIPPVCSTDKAFFASISLSISPSFITVVTCFKKQLKSSATCRAFASAVTVGGCPGLLPPTFRWWSYFSSGSNLKLIKQSHPNKTPPPFASPGLPMVVVADAPGDQRSHPVTISQTRPATTPSCSFPSKHKPHLHINANRALTHGSRGSPASACWGSIFSGFRNEYGLELQNRRPTTVQRTLSSPPATVAVSDVQLGFNALPQTKPLHCVRFVTMSLGTCWLSEPAKTTDPGQ